jgi:hypothetical protein
MVTHAHAPQGTSRPSRARVNQFLRLKYIPMSLEGALNPMLTMEQKGQMLTACAARFAYMFQHHPEIAQILRDLSLDPSLLPPSDGELTDYLHLSPEENQKFRISWPGFKVVCLGTADGMLDNEKRNETPKEAETSQPIRRGKY